MLKQALVAFSPCLIGKELEWDFIHGLFENAIYGGRVDNPFDMRVLRSYLAQYFNKEMLAGSSARRSKKIPGGNTIPVSTYYKVLLNPSLSLAIVNALMSLLVNAQEVLFEVLMIGVVILRHHTE